MYTSRAPRGLYAAWPALTGLLLMLSYPPYDLAVLAWFALVPLLWCAFADGEGRGRRRRLAGGMGAGTGFPPGGRAWRSGIAPSLAFAGGLLWGVGLFYPLLLIREGTWVERAGGTAIIALLTATTLGLFYAARSGKARASFRAAVGSRSLSLRLFGSVWSIFRAVAGRLFNLFRSDAMARPRSARRRLGRRRLRCLLAARRGQYGDHDAHIWAASTTLGLGGADQRESPWPSHSHQPMAPARSRTRDARSSVARWASRAAHLTHPTPGDARSLPGAGASSALRLVLIQPQITPEEYRQARSGIDAQRQLWQRVMAQSASALERLEQQGDAGAEVLVVLPETVVHYTAWDDPTFRVRFSQFARNEQTNWLIGLPRSAEMIDGPLGVDERALDLQHRNSVFFIDRRAPEASFTIRSTSSLWRKASLLPAGRRASSRSGVTCSASGSARTLSCPITRSATMRAGAGSLHYVASLGHIGGISRLERAFVVFRVAEHGVYVTQTATTGPTFAVDPRGRIVAAAPWVRLTKSSSTSCRRRQVQRPTPVSVTGLCWLRRRSSFPTLFSLWRRDDGRIDKAPNVSHRYPA